MRRTVSDEKQTPALSFTCQKMLSMVLPRKPSLLSDDRSLGPSIVMNSSKSTWPSPAGRHTYTHRKAGRQTGIIENQIHRQGGWQTGAK